jgi:hypothetical protein
MLSELPGAARIGGLADAWYWSPAPGIDFAAVICPDGRHVFQVATRDSYDADLCRAVLGFALDHSEDLVGSLRPVTVIPGFALADRQFDVVVARRPSPNRRYTKEPSGLEGLTIPVSPAYHYEFSGDENEEDCDFRFKRMLGVPDLDREPCPFVKMRFHNTRGQARTPGPERVFVYPIALYTELRDLEDSPDSFVEFENWQGIVCRAEWRDGLTLTEEGVTVPITLAELVDRADALLFA